VDEFHVSTPKASLPTYKMLTGVPGSTGARTPVHVAMVANPEIVGEVPEYPAGPEMRDARVVCVMAFCPCWACKLKPQASASAKMRTALVKFFIFSFSLRIVSRET
jgi:hypothetical protein